MAPGEYLWERGMPWPEGRMGVWKERGELDGGKVAATRARRVRPAVIGKADSIDERVHRALCTRMANIVASFRILNLFWLVEPSVADPGSE